jgi:catechol 2,3-dioxygenase-like lactoylglutathione lyase family enzyme
VVGVADMDRAVAWYCDKLGLSFESKEPGSREVYLGHPSGDLDMIPMIILVPIPRGQTNVYAEFPSLEIQLGPIQSDSGGNRFFKWQDLEGNTVEVSETRGASRSASRIG